ncbi:MAG: response regulator transcription factor [Methylococcaceae bacterium]
MTHITLVEDEPALREELAAFLSGRGHDVLQAGCLEDFWPLVPNTAIAIIDIMLPDGNGFDAAAKLKSHNTQSGIIMLTARGALHDKLQGYDSGADHYLVKPVRLLELGAIIDALKRRVCSGWRLDTRVWRLISPAGDEITLGEMELKLFEMLSSSSGTVVTRQELIEALGMKWVDYDLRRLDTHICRFRQRWQNISGEVLPLKTVHRKGYSFGENINLI